MPLTDVKIRQAKPSEKPYRMSDGGGLFMEVRPNGSKLWRYAYRIGKKQNTYAVGAYPEMSLQGARAEHMRVRSLVSQGVHPSHDRASKRNETLAEGKNTFKAIAKELIAEKETTEKRSGWSETYTKQVKSYLRRFLYPKFEHRPIRSITSLELLEVIRGISKKNGPSAATLARQIASQVFEYAIATLRADNDPTYPVRNAIIRPDVEHADPKDREFLHDLYGRISAYGGRQTTKIAARLLAMLFVRTKELRTAPWTEFDLSRAVWIIQPERMKKRRRHIVPLPRQAVELLRELHKITGTEEFLFPNIKNRKKPMSRETINRALQYMKYPVGVISGHDFRATASTLLNEMGYRPDVVDIQLAHAQKDKTSATYNHALYLPERVKMMQAWADWLEEVEQGKPSARLPAEDLPLAA